MANNPKIATVQAAWREKVKKDQKVKKEFERLLGLGKTYVEISPAIGVSLKTCERWGREIKERELEPTAGKTVPVCNGPGTNQMERINTVESKPPASPSGVAIINKGSVRAEIKLAGLAHGLRVSALKLWDIIRIKFTEKNKAHDGSLCTQVEIPLEEYMRLTGKPNTSSSMTNARRTAKEDLETLYGVSLDWTETNGARSHFKMRLCFAQGIVNSTIVFGLSPPMAAYLAGAYITHYPVELLKLDDHSANAYYLGKKLALHHGMYSNIENKSNDILSVASLLEHCEDTIPSHERVMGGDRNTKKHIIEPFIRGMDCLAAHGVLTWKFCREKKAPFEGEPADYQEFINLFIEFHILT
jgi:hypothetical protein